MMDILLLTILDITAALVFIGVILIVVAYKDKRKEDGTGKNRRK